VAFITLGDPTVYSTYIYLHKLIRRKGYDTEIVPGVTSFCASAARAGISLAEGDESFAVVPGAYECGDFESIIDAFDNVVIMKAVKSLPVLKMLLKEKGLAEKAVMVSKCGFPDEIVNVGLDVDENTGLSYFTTMIVKRGGL
jgi:precorrin-2/cobalt-factor-2 C20-methyltransferase